MDIQGAIITIDAMGDAKSHRRPQIIKQKADYVLALKGNQERLHDVVIEYIDRQLENDFAGIDVRQHTTTETAHGRDETRCYTHLPVPSDLPNADQWKGLKSIGMAISACVRRERNHRETLLPQQPAGRCEALRACRARSLGHRE